MLDGKKLWKVFKGAMIAGAGAALAYLSEYASGTELGVWAPIVTAGLAVAVNILRKMAEPPSQDEP